jgi:hypothetical protein
MEVTRGNQAATRDGEVVDALRELLRQRRVVTINPTARADEWLFADKRGNHINVDNFKGAHFTRLCGRVDSTTCATRVRRSAVMLQVRVL